MFKLQALPSEVFDLVIENLVVKIGIQKAIRLRTVNSDFNTSIMHAICVAQVVSIDDCATPMLVHYMSSALRGKIIAMRSRLAKEDDGGYLAVVAKLRRTLREMVGDSDEKMDEAREQAVAEAVKRTNKPIDARIDSQNLLCGAVLLGDLRLVTSLLEGSASSGTIVEVNGSTPYFRDPLTLAATGGHFEVLRYLLSRGALPSSDSFHWKKSSKRGHLSDWNVLDEYAREMELSGDTPSALRAAVGHSHEDIVRLLLQPEYRLPLDSLEYLRAAFAGAQAGRMDLIELIFATIGKAISDFRGLDKLLAWAAVRSGQKAVVQRLLDEGLDVNASREHDYPSHYSALEIAASLGNVGMVRFLLERGADVNRDESYRQDHLPVAVAARHGHEDVVMLLIDHGADPAKAIPECAGGAQPRLLKSLLRQYPDLILRDGGALGFQTFYRSLSSRNLTAMTILVEAGFGINDYSEYYCDTPMGLAKKICPAWVRSHILSLGAEDTEEEATPRECEGYARNILIYERTWEWPGKY